MKQFKITVAFCALIMAAWNSIVFAADEIVVTGSREAELKKETAATVGVIKKEEIKDVKPNHPSEIMNRVPGVWVNVTAGEGHVTAIRQPLTTNPVYLYLEDGIPVRSTGFFNHNALYEINIPGAERLEVTKGPGSALYGSDAIGGSINAVTKAPPLKPEAEVTLEAGEDGWKRMLFTTGNTSGDDGLLLDGNLTKYDGWRERSAYERKSVTMRIDRAIGADASLKTVFSFSDIDQATGGSNGLLYADFKTRPEHNYHTFDFRRVRALRLSSAYEKELSKTSLLSITPYLRINQMDLLPGWGIFQAGANYYGYDSTTEFTSLGLLAKYRKDFDTWRTRVITGIDIDHTPGKYEENRIQAFKTGDKYTSYIYTVSTTNNYDYDATFTGISPYAQGELSPIEKLRATIGLRYDNLSYDYATHLAPNANRPESTEKSFRHFSPKAGVTYELTPSLNGFISYSHAFRAPSSGDLFRGSQGTALTAVNLKPIKVNSYEAGLRGKAGEKISYELSLYTMTKKDDIVTYSVALNVNERRNAGETSHKGVEAGIDYKIFDVTTLGVSASYAVHRFEDYRPSALIDYSGNEIPQAPRVLVNARLKHTPAILNRGFVELEWTRLGKYWMDDANTERYDGHDVYNARASYYLTKKIELYLKAINLTNKLYAERASKSGVSPAQYAPGQPRTFFGGVTYKWEKESR